MLSDLLNYITSGPSILSQAVNLVGGWMQGSTIWDNHDVSKVTHKIPFWKQIISVNILNGVFGEGPTMVVLVDGTIKMGPLRIIIFPTKK
jgi:hypothetical protein